MKKQLTGAEEIFNKTVRTTLVFQSEDFWLPSDTQYGEVLQHIHEHTYYTNTSIPKILSFEEGVYSWYEDVYEPVMRAVDGLGLLRHIPQSTRGELYLWITRHWHFLKEKKNKNLHPRRAALDFGRRFSASWYSRFRYTLGLIWTKLMPTFG